MAGVKVRASFLASDRTYCARRVWHDVIADNVACGLHRIERLMRLQALKAKTSFGHSSTVLGTKKGDGLSPPPKFGENETAYQFLVTRNPKRRGSVVKTFVVRPVSSELRNAPVIAVVLNTFFM